MTDDKPAGPARTGPGHTKEDPMPDTATQDTVAFYEVDQEYTSDFTRGYALAIAWLTKGAPVIEAQALWGIFVDTRRDEPAEEATFVLDATLFPSLLSHLDHIKVYDGHAHQAECIRRFGKSFEDARYPKQAFSWPTGVAPLHEGFMTAIDQVMGL